MKNSKFLIFIVLSLFLTSYTVKAQITSFGKMLTGGIEDAEKLFEGYFTPAVNAFGATLNGGWYNTAKCHKLGGFDLTLTINTALIPEIDKTFNLDDYNLAGEYNPNESYVPTVAGESEAGTEISYIAEVDVPEIGTQMIPLASFYTPKGAGLGYLPVPMIQVGIGLIKETEIIGRFLPTLKAGHGDYKVGMWGVGIKHSLKQWIPAVNKIPFFNLSFLGGYTKLTGNAAIELTPDDVDFGGTTVYDLTNGAFSWDDQNLKLVSNAFTANIIVSADLPIITFYGGLGFATTKTNLSVTGYYPLPTVQINPSEDHYLEPVINESSVVKDPIDIEIKNSDGGTTKPRFNIGVRLKLAVVTLHVDYIYSKYSVVTGGLGISIR